MRIGRKKWFFMTYTHFDKNVRHLNINLCTDTLLPTKDMKNHDIRYQDGTIDWTVQSMDSYKNGQVTWLWKIKF